MVWARAVGLDCCYAAMMFLRDVAKCTCVVDPFAGHGTVLAMANALGVSARGVELSSKRCKKALALTITEEVMASVSKVLRKALQSPAANGARGSLLKTSTTSSRKQNLGDLDSCGSSASQDKDIEQNTES